MRIPALLRRGLVPIALALLALRAGAFDVVDDARRLAQSKNWPALVQLIEEYYQFQVSDPTLDELLGAGLMNLGRADEAAHFIDRAIEKLANEESARRRKLVEQLDPEAEIARLKKRRDGLDPLGSKRDTLLKSLVKDLFDSAGKLQEAGHSERALEILERIKPASRGPQTAEIAALADKIRSSTERVNLDVKGDAGKPADGWPEVTVESKRYTIIARLEPEIAEALGRTMDEVFEFYLRIYFDGDEGRVNARKAAIHVLSSREEMLQLWQGKSAPLGWWSPMEWQVTTYDTRADAHFGTLDQMLDTLFHEASHHFMTMLAKDGFTPAWLNEGTASFFEGTVAMADGRVLWPDAANLRLQEFEFLTRGAGMAKAPKLADVIGYDQPGSYPGEYYAFGWGLVYFMQQYEDKTTFEYVYRPLYNRFRDEVIKRGEKPREIFESVFLGPSTPLKHKSLEDFDKDWRSWIQTKIYPLHFGNDRRKLRMAEVKRYLDAAPAPATDKKSKQPAQDPTRKAKVSDQELLLRALGHIEYVRTKVDKPEEPDPELLLLQADVLERLGRGASAAPILEQLLELAADGTWKATADKVAEIEKRLGKLDQKNAPLRIAKSRNKALIKRAQALVDEYAKLAPGLPLRSYTFAMTVANALGEPKELRERAQELRVKARDLGLLKGSMYRLVGAESTWRTIFSMHETAFDCQPDKIVLENSGPAGRLCTAVPISGEYEVRARIQREGESKVGQQHGLIFSGSPTGDSMAVVVDQSGKLMIKRMLLGPSGGASDEGGAWVALKNPPAFDKPFDMKVHVTAGGEIEVTVGTEGPFPLRAPLPLPAIGYVGVYVKSGRGVFEKAVAEIVP